MQNPVIGSVQQLTHDDSGALRSALIESAKLAGEFMSAENMDALREWIREPDYVENASLQWLMDWVNRRPLWVLR